MGQPMVPTIYVAENCLVYPQWEEIGLVLWRLDISEKTEKEREAETQRDRERE